MEPITLRVLTALIAAASAKGLVSITKFVDGRRNIEEQDGTTTTVRPMTADNADGGLYMGEDKLGERLSKALKNNAGTLAVAIAAFTALSFNVYGSDEAVQQFANNALTPRGYA